MSDSGYGLPSVTASASKLVQGTTGGKIGIDWLSTGNTTADVAIGNHVHPYTEQVCLTEFVPAPNKVEEYNFHGFLIPLNTAAALSTGSPVTINGGLSKILIVINAGSDVAGTMTLTGTTVNRNTGAESAADTDDITVDALSTDTSDTDAEGNVRHAFSGAYLSSKWFKGDVTLSTSTLTLTDVDIYQVAYEQFNDEPNLTINTLDCTIENVAAGSPAEWMYVYLYALERTGSKCDITRIASLELPIPTNAGAFRLRKGNIAKALDGSTDGVWADAWFGPTVVNEWANMTLKIWATIGDSTSAIA